MWERAWTTPVVISCLSLGVGAAGAAELNRSSERIRTSDTTIVRLFEYALSRSPSFRELVATFDFVERTVDLQHDACHVDTDAVCSHVVPVTTATKLLLKIDARQTLGAAVGQLAHGLYHALEIAREAGVRDDESRRRLFARIGERRCPGDNDACWETRAATAFEALVLRELAGVEPTLPSKVQFTDRGTHQLAASLLRASPTFRRQCAIVDAIEQLAVVVVQQRGALPQSVRARTHLRRYNTGVIAIVEFPTLTNPAMLAHEFEHVIEYAAGGERVGRGSTFARDSKWVRAAEQATRRELSAADPVTRAIGRMLNVHRAPL